jgi:hypothetical protein
MTMSQSRWLRQRGTLFRFAIDAQHDEYGTWTLPCEINLRPDLSGDSVIPWLKSARLQVTPPPRL